MEIKERQSRETAREYALRTITENIIMLNLEPGSLVSENELAAEMGLSRTPVREALIELSKSRIVEIYPQKGSYISKIDYAMVEEARFLRLVLEKAIIEAVCVCATPGEMEELEENVHLQDFYLENLSPSKLMDLDNSFHKKLFLIANKMQTYQLMNSMMAHFDRVRSMSFTAVRNIKIVEDHRQILNAVKQRDREAAVAIMTRHLSRYKIDEAALREKYPAYFK